MLLGSCNSVFVQIANIKKKRKKKSLIIAVSTTWNHIIKILYFKFWQCVLLIFLTKYMVHHHVKQRGVLVYTKLGLYALKTTVKHCCSN